MVIRAEIQYLYTKVLVEYRTGTLLLSSWLPIGKEFSLGCRAEIRTRIALQQVVSLLS
jgi:hypothetical protein